jgi:hypothetical protein
MRTSRRRQFHNGVWLWDTVNTDIHQDPRDAASFIHVKDFILTCAFTVHLQCNVHVPWDPEPLPPLPCAAPPPLRSCCPAALGSPAAAGPPRRSRKAPQRRSQSRNCAWTTDFCCASNMPLPPCQCLRNADALIADHASFYLLCLSKSNHLAIIKHKPNASFHDRQHDYHRSDTRRRSQKLAFVQVLDCMQAGWIFPQTSSGRRHAHV